jgi:hypothetical protein
MYSGNLPISGFLRGNNLKPSANIGRDMSDPRPARQCTTTCGTPQLTSGNRIEGQLKKSLNTLKPVRLRQVRGVKAIAQENVEDLSRESPMPSCARKLCREIVRRTIQCLREFAGASQNETLQR